jgi:hypothetical protein
MLLGFAFVYYFNGFLNENCRIKFHKLNCTVSKAPYECSNLAKCFESKEYFSR